MVNKNLYEKYHKNLKLHKKIISENDFTYRNIIGRISKYIPNKGTVLDIGSATGTMSFYLASKNLKVVGLELSKNAIKYANLNKTRLSIKNVNFVNSSVEKYNKNTKYDFITCFEVLEHIEDDKLLIARIYKYMTDNAVLAVSVPSLNAPLYRLGLLSKFDKNVGHLRRYSMSRITKLLHDHGFKILSKHKDEGILRNILFTNKMAGMLIKLTRFEVFNSIISQLDAISLFLFGESQLILICKKDKK